MRFSVVIPAFNASGSIERAIRSVLAQTEQDFEIIVVDDASKDDTALVVARCQDGDRRIRLLQQAVNSGPAAARNCGIEAARGDWIAMLDGDDAFAPRRLDTLGTIGEREAADLIFDNLELYDWVAGESVGTALASPAAGHTQPVSPAFFFKETRLGRSAFDLGQLKCVVRRSVLEANDIRYPDNLRHSEDFVFYAGLLLAGARSVLVGDALYLFTQRVGSRSKVASGQSRTKVDLEGMRAATRELLSHPVVAGDPELGQLVRDRLAAIDWHESLLRLMPHLEQRDPLGALGACVTDWRTAVIAAELVLRRLGGSRKAR